MFEAKSLFTPLKLVAAILLDDVLGAYPFLLLPDEWFYFLMNQAYFLMNVSASPRSVSASGRGRIRRIVRLHHEFGTQHHESGRFTNPAILRPSLRGALRAPTAPSRLAVRPCTCPAATKRVAWAARDGGASRPWPLGRPARRPRAWPRARRPPRSCSGAPPRNDEAPSGPCFLRRKGPAKRVRPPPCRRRRRPSRTRALGPDGHRVGRLRPGRGFSRS